MLKLPHVFSDHAVLQRNKPIAVFGESDSDVIVSFRGKDYSANVTDGRFEIYLDPCEAENDLSMTFQNASESITLTDLAVGEVWLAGGQSNMEIPLSLLTDGLLDLKIDGNQKKIRTVCPPRTNEDGSYQGGVKDGFYFWRDACPDLSGVAYYFANTLVNNLGVTVGIVECNVGASSSLNWIPREDIMADETLKKLDLGQEIYLSRDFKRVNEAEFIGISREFPYGYLYEHQLKQIMPYTLTGVIWYQGESDGAGKPSGEYYKLAFDTMRKAWRKGFKAPELPFLTVMLAASACGWMGGYYGEPWAHLRAAQIELAEEKNTYFISALDCGHPANVHPSDKHPIGSRLAACALSEIYGQDIPWKCPMPDHVDYENGTVKIYLKNTYGSLFADTWLGDDFQVQIFFRTWMNVSAKIVDDHIELDLGADQAPTVISHAFFNCPHIRIHNKYGLPLVPFQLSFDITKYLK